MSIATKDWSDDNRFNQTGYSAGTLMPKRENYKSEKAFEEDLKAAEWREQSHQEWLDELRHDYEEERRYNAHCDDEDCCDEDCDDEDYG